MEGSGTPPGGNLPPAPWAFALLQDCFALVLPVPGTGPTGRAGRTAAIAWLRTGFEIGIAALPAAPGGAGNPRGALEPAARPWPEWGQPRHTDRSLVT